MVIMTPSASDLPLHRLDAHFCGRLRRWHFRRRQWLLALTQSDHNRRPHQLSGPRSWHHCQQLGDLPRVAGGVGSDATAEAVDGRAKAMQLDVVDSRIVDVGWLSRNRSWIRHRGWLSRCSNQIRGKSPGALRQYCRRRFGDRPRERPIFKGFASLAAVALRTQLLKT